MYRNLFALLFLCLCCIDLIGSQIVYTTGKDNNFWIDLDCDYSKRYQDVSSFGIVIQDRRCDGKPIVKTIYEPDKAEKRVDQEIYRKATIICTTQNRYYYGTPNCTFANDDPIENGLYYPTKLKSVSIRFDDDRQTLNKIRISIYIDYESDYQASAKSNTIVQTILFVGLAIVGICINRVLMQEIIKSLFFDALMMCYVLLCYAISVCAMVLACVLIFNMEYWPKSEEMVNLVRWCLIFVYTPLYGIVGVTLPGVLFQFLSVCLVLCGLNPDYDDPYGDEEDLMTTTIKDAEDPIESDDSEDDDIVALGEE